jgi:hypothetical protein
MIVAADFIIIHGLMRLSASFGIDRWPTHCAVEAAQFPPQLAKLGEPADRPQEMTGRTVGFQRELRTEQPDRLADVPS